jgi:hypothetical protein
MWKSSADNQTKPFCGLDSLESVRLSQASTLSDSPTRRWAFPIWSGLDMVGKRKQTDGIPSESATVGVHSP